MTSLARQLQRLAVPHTQAVLASDTKRVSLLFDPKEAATIDREALFALGLSGLEELESLDESFGEFSLSLFNKSSQNWERSLQTKEVNEKLDQTIEKFLMLMSPYFLLKSSHKALEWLIYRYHVHQFNVDQLLMCVLPYHETKIFVRVLQLLKLSDPTDKWHWLEEANKAGVPVARSTLVNHCKKDPGFLSFICSILPKAVKHNGTESKQLRSVIAFYTCTVLGAIQDRLEITERIVSVLLPHLVTGLKSKCVDYKAASYMILSQLCVQTKLQEKLITTLLPVITKSVAVSLSQEALTCILLICQTQKVESFTKKTVKHLCRIPALVQHLSKMGSMYELDSFLGHFLVKLVPYAIKHGVDSESSSDGGSEELMAATPEYAAILEGILTDVPLKKEVATKVTRMLIEELFARRKVSGLSEADTWQVPARRYLTVLDRKYTASVDAAIVVLSARNLDEMDSLYLQDLMATTSLPVKYQVMPNSSTCLMLGLNNPRPKIRCMALKHLSSCCLQNKDLTSEFIEEVILARLNDDEPKVVDAVLDMKAPLHELIDIEKLKAAILKVIKKGHGVGNWTATVKHCLAYLCEKDMSKKSKLSSLELLSYLLVTKTSHIAVASVILESDFAMDDIFLKKVAPEWKKKANTNNSAETCAEYNNILIEGVASALSKHKQAIQTVEELLKRSLSEDVSYAFVSLTVLGLSMNDTIGKDLKVAVQLGLGLLDMLKKMVERNKYSKESDVKVDKSKAGLLKFLPQWTQCLSKTNSLHIGMIQWAFGCLSGLMCNFGKQAPGGMWWDLNNLHLKLVIKYLEWTLKQACCPNTGAEWRKNFVRFTKDVLDIQSLVKLSALVCSNEALGDLGLKDISPVLQAGSFHLIKQKWLQADSASVAKALQAKSPVLPCLFASLVHPQSVIRHGALQCLEVLREKCKSDASSSMRLVKKLIKHKEEILADDAHTALVVSKVFSSVDKEVSFKESKSLEDKMDSLETLLTTVTTPETPSGIKERLLLFLQAVPHEHVLEKVLPLAENLLQKCQESKVSKTEISILQHVIVRYDEETANSLQPDGTLWNFMKGAIHGNQTVGESLTPQTMMLNQLSREFFTNLSSIEVQRKFVSLLLDVGITDLTSDVMTNLRNVFKQLKLESSQVQHELNTTPEEISQTASVKGRKRARTKLGSEGKVDWRRVTLLLEILQTRKKVKAGEEMVAILFPVLSSLLVEDNEENEYRMQLAFSVILGITSKWNKLEVEPKEETVNVEVLVQCIRSTKGPQTQQQALLVMASVAHLFPETILHNVMSIFTFMGNTLLQQDDSHSFQVIARTIETVIPALLQTQKTKAGQKKFDDIIANILRVFVDARHHVPKHRSHLVFQTLMQTIGPEKYLWMVMTLLMESSVSQKDAPTVSDDPEELPGVDKDMEFTLNIVELFPSHIQVQAATRVLVFLQTLTDVHGQGEQQSQHGGRNVKKTVPQIELINVATRGHQQLRLLQYHLTRLLATLLTKDSFVNQVASQNEDSDEQNDAMETDTPDFQTFVKETLCYMTTVAKYFGVCSGAMVKFWRAVLFKIYDILDKVNYLLTNTTFLEVIMSLMTHDVMSVRRKALDLLNTKLQQIQLQHLDDNEVDSLLKVVDTVANIAHVTSKDHDADTTACQQMALFSLKLLCKLLGPDYPEKFTPLLKISVDILKKGSLPLPVLSSTLLCIAELCSVLKAHAIPQLPQFMPPLITVLKDSKTLKSNELVLMCSLTALQRVVGSLPHFLSPYLGDILLTISHISCFVPDDPNSKSQPTIRLRAVKHQVATGIASRVLIPSLSECFSQLLKEKQMGVLSVMSIAKEHVDAIAKEDLNSHHGELVTFFLHTLDLRNADLQISWKDMENCELSVISAILSMVVRLSENTFRPMFYKLYDWACREDGDAFRNRKLAFFRLSELISDKLKSLFNLFVGHSLRTACGLLQKLNTMNGEVTYFGKSDEAVKKSCLLIEYILGMLHKCLLHDTEGFVNKDVFNLLMQPLVDQLENVVGSEEDYENRVSDHVTQCISQLAVASKDDASWKSLNYQVLLKSRHSSPKVRFAALKTVESIAEKLGDEYMPLLPETVPFLAELMEDDSEEVEQQCQKVIRNMEEILGESLQKYF